MIRENQSLQAYNSFGLDVCARYFAQPESIEALKSCVTTAQGQGLPVLILGGGSNFLFETDVNGWVIQPLLRGIEIVWQADGRIGLGVGAGEVWDDLVAYCVDRGWGGLENLSLIPGRVGAAPVQNIGAYGAEAKDVITAVEGLYLDSLEPFFLSEADCGFGYRDSIFKRALKDKVVITKVFFELSTRPETKTDYGRIAEMLAQQPDNSIRSVRAAVMAIRREKLPDPEVLGNAGSFFKNPSLPKDKALAIQALYPSMPIYNSDIEGYSKIPAAFLIEQCGWKGQWQGLVGVHSQQPLVLVAHKGATGAALAKLYQKIQASVQEKFGVSLECEVNHFKGF